MNRIRRSGGWIDSAAGLVVALLAAFAAGGAPAVQASPLPLTVAQAGNCAARNRCLNACAARRANCLAICRSRSTARTSGCTAAAGCAYKYRSCYYACSRLPPGQQASCRAGCSSSRADCERSCVRTVRPSNCSAQCGYSCASRCPPCGR